jgi:hypothetical protein
MLGHPRTGKEETMKEMTPNKLFPLFLTHKLPETKAFYEGKAGFRVAVDGSVSAWCWTSASKPCPPARSRTTSERFRNAIGNAPQSHSPNSLGQASECSTGTPLSDPAFDQLHLLGRQCG